MKVLTEKPKNKPTQTQKAPSFDDYNELFNPDKKRLHGKHPVPKLKKYQPKFW